MLETTVSESVISNEVSISRAPVQMNRLQLSGFLHKLNGRFVGVDFVKQDGSVRALNGRLGVHAHSKGGENKVVKDSRPYLTIFDAQANEYRTLNLATVLALRADRSTYQIVG